nr:hypothetical protein [Tanacetum cinerariifolium]
MTPEVIEELINQRVAEALFEQEANRNPGPIVKSDNRYGDEEGDSNGGGNENGNGEGNGNHGNGNHNGMNGGAGGNAPVARVCTYKDFLNCQPHGALTWWNSYVQTVGIGEAYEMSWKDLMKLMIEELTFMCLRMVYEEEDKIKRENVARTYTVGNNEKRGYHGSVPYCNICKLHHEGQYTIKYGNYKKVHHMTRDCKATVAATPQGGPVVQQRTVTYFECGRKEHFKKDCPKLKKQNRGKQAANNKACGRAYALGGGEPNQDSNVVTANGDKRNCHGVKELVLECDIDLECSWIGKEGEQCGSLLIG